MTAKLCNVAAKASAATDRYAYALIKDRSGAVQVDDALHRIAEGLHSAGPA